MRHGRKQDEKMVKQDTVSVTVDVIALSLYIIHFLVRGATCGVVTYSMICTVRIH